MPSKKPTTRKNASKKGAKSKPAAAASSKKKARKPAGKRAFAPVLADAATENLNKIEHIVVLMLENRSFDQMLGYLKLEGIRADLDGLTPGLSNTHQGRSFPIHHYKSTVLNDDQDPSHSPDSVIEQLSGNNGGFVKNYAKTNPLDPDPGTVMGYYNAGDLPVYDHLAREFCVCDRWFSSVPGATWPNRLYAVTGRADKKKDNKTPPFYNLPSFVRHLDVKKVSWRWYAHERVLFSTMTTLKLTDRKYLSKGNHKFFKKDFFDDAKQGKLPAVSWIDPNFVDFGGQFESNDDHAPADVLAGQELVLRIYHALLNSPQWSKTLFIVTYDEHGGFYDHVQPDSIAKPQDDDPNFLSYGVRVPAIVISPHVGRASASHMVFDHTSIVKTILTRFCQTNGAIPDMGTRVNAANHLGGLLTEAAARPPIPQSNYQTAIDRIAEWHKQKFDKALVLSTRDRAPRPLSEFQQGLEAARKRLISQEMKSRRR
jgi:phospholipase C